MTKSSKYSTQNKTLTYTYKIRINSNWIGIFPNRQLWAIFSYLYLSLFESNILSEFHCLHRRMRKQKNSDFSYRFDYIIWFHCHIWFISCLYIYNDQFMHFLMIFAEYFLVLTRRAICWLIMTIQIHFLFWFWLRTSHFPRYNMSVLLLLSEMLFKIAQTSTYTHVQYLTTWIEMIFMYFSAFFPFIVTHCSLK